MLGAIPSRGFAEPSPLAIGIDPVGVGRQFWFAANGSFVTDAYEPNDVDCVLLVDAEFLKNAIVQSEFEAGLPFLEIKVVGKADFDYLVEVVFGSDRDVVPKGAVEIVEWS